ncbi:MAG: hypothetical protein EZS28_026905 [Streblomastix strix]|uniref:Uncharacterized protein n=1 Tax=Streblomastix strix TaxID=222440 RepID=A0A5J4V488_9EUKA|nr:MAG: hypothetical protein EZS28_026905 [Streblomastix strix]
MLIDNGPATSKTNGMVVEKRRDEHIFSYFLDSNPLFEQARKAHYYQTLTRLQKRHAKLIIFRPQPIIRKGTQSSFDVDTNPNYQ